MYLQSKADTASVNVLEGVPMAFVDDKKANINISIHKAIAQGTVIMLPIFILHYRFAYFILGIQENHVFGLSIGLKVYVEQ